MISCNGDTIINQNGGCTELKEYSKITVTTPNFAERCGVSCFKSDIHSQPMSSHI